jgi:hypothetical protein
MANIKTSEADAKLKPVDVGPRYFIIIYFFNYAMTFSSAHYLLELTVEQLT